MMNILLSYHTVTYFFIARVVNGLLQTPTARRADQPPIQRRAQGGWKACFPPPPGTSSPASPRVTPIPHFANTGMVTTANGDEGTVVCETLVHGHTQEPEDVVMRQQHHQQRRHEEEATSTHTPSKAAPPPPMSRFSAGGGSRGTGLARSVSAGAGAPSLAGLTVMPPPPSV